MRVLHAMLLILRVYDSYDILTNISENHEYIQLILNRGLTVSDDKFGGLGFRVK